MEFVHKPIMVEECISMLNIMPNGIYVDGTVGGGGHSYEIASRLNQEGMLICIDRDKEAIEASKNRLAKLEKNIKFIHNNFCNIKKVVEGITNDFVDGILIDLGVSSYQMDNSERGFSYQADALLDMRMDKGQTLTAETVVNQYDKDRLVEIIFSYSEERWAKRIAEFIVRYRQERRIRTTAELVEIIKKAIPAAARRDGPHPAKRTFQAIRIEVNNELTILRDAIKNAVDCLNRGGRICIITFHSLEDRIVKQTYAALEGKCTCPPDFPVCRCKNKTYGKVVNRKPIEPSQAEILDNPRARSAKLRVFERN